MAETHEVDLLVLTDGEENEGGREDVVPPSVRLLWGQTRKRPAVRRLVGEMLGRGPGYFETSFDLGATASILDRTEYDLAWVTPVSEWGFVRHRRKSGRPLAKTVALGLNDVTTTLYAEFFTEQFAGRGVRDAKRLLRGLRTPWIALYERAYLREADLIHVQTDLEEQRVRRLLGRKSPAVVVAPNGKNEDLGGVEYQRNETKRVLYMTHLDGARAHESRWFLQFVWPQIQAEVEGAELWLVGTPPEPDNPYYNGEGKRGVRTLGYVKDLADLFEAIDVAVVPIYHGTGLINRVQDAMAAGVPLVATGRPLATVAGLEVGRHALQADTAASFAGQVVRVLKDQNLRAALAKEAKALGTQLPTWEGSTRRIAASIGAITDVGSAPVRTGNP